MSAAVIPAIQTYSIKAKSYILLHSSLTNVLKDTLENERSIAYIRSQMRETKWKAGFIHSPQGVLNPPNICSTYVHVSIWIGRCTTFSSDGIFRSMMLYPDNCIRLDPTSNRRYSKDGSWMSPYCPDRNTYSLRAGWQVQRSIVYHPTQSRHLNREPLASPGLSLKMNAQSMAKMMSNELYDLDRTTM